MSESPRGLNENDALEDDGDLELPRHVEWDGIGWMVPQPDDGGQGRMARAFRVSRRTISRWKRNGRIPFYSADRALAQIDEHPILFWPEAFGLSPEERIALVPDVLRPRKKSPQEQRAARIRFEYARSRKTPPGAIGDGATRVLLALVTSRRPTITNLVEASGLQRGTVHAHLKSLRKAGLAEWVDGKSATLRPLVSASSVAAVEIES